MKKPRSSKVRAVQDSISDLVERFGWAVVSVMPTKDSPQPHVAFAYTIGLHRKGLPELFMAGLAPQSLIDCLNLAAQVLVSAGGVEDGQTTDRIADRFPCMFRSLPADVVSAKGLQALAFAGGEVEGAHVVFPDSQGRWPWDPECEPTTRLVQSVIFEHGQPAPRSPRLH